MKAHIILIGWIFIITLSKSTFGQGDSLVLIPSSSLKKNSALFQVGIYSNRYYNLTTFSAAYSRIIIGKNESKKFHLGLGANFGGRISSNVREGAENYYFITPTLTMFFGRTDHFFEIELGVMKLLNYPKTLRDGGLTHTRYTEYANVKLGYRYQSKESGVLFRIGVGFPTGLYVGLGYVF